MELLVWILTFLVFIFSHELVGGVDRQVLDDILGKTSPNVAPNLPINVSFSIDFQCFIFNQETRELRTVAEERYLWADRRVSWENDVNKNMLLRGANMLTVSSSLLWTPDIQLYNRIKLSERDHEAMARIFYNGTVAWFLVAVHYTLCSKDERQLIHEDKVLNLAKCRLKFGPWTHLSSELYLSNLSGSYFDLRHYDANCAKILAMTSSVMETYSSAMVYYDFDVVVSETPYVEPEEPAPPPIDPEPEVIPEEPVVEALTSQTSQCSMPLISMMLLGLTGHLLVATLMF